MFPDINPLPGTQRQAAALKPAVILIDFQLPDVTGLTLAPALRGLTPSSRLILMTGMATGDLATDAVRGVDDVLTKPVPVDRLLALLKRHSTSAE